MYIPYKSISRNPNCVSFVPQEISAAQSVAAELISKKHPKWDAYIQKMLGYASEEDLFNALSAEQIDACGFIIEQIKAKSGVILADETGVGKGRTLASIYKYCKMNKKKLLFFTYNKDLFSDFVRDLNDIGVEDLSGLHVMHNDVVVYNSKEEVVFKSKVKKNKQLIADKDIAGLDLIMTTYSQINSKASKTKLEFLLKYAKNSIIVMDESHNAAGQSNTRKNIEKLIDEADACVYASATFLKNEDEFNLYKKAIDNLDSQELEYLRLALEDENCEKLRSYFTVEMVKCGKLIRREHEPMKTKWEHILVDVGEQSQMLDSASEIFSDLFNVIEATSEYETVYDTLKSSWFLAGSHINRVFKNIILLLKIDDLVKNIELDLKNNHKPVVVMESTFASILNNLVNNNFGGEDDFASELEDDVDFESVEGTKHKLSFKNYIAWLIDQILQKNIPPFGLNQDIYDKMAELNKKLENFDDSFASLSPIDKIKNKIKELGFTCVEISGRDFEVIESVNNGVPELEIIKIKKEPKTLLVNQFNNGVADVAILTRSGSTGFSMHNAPHFKDTRTRTLYELEISSRPQVRVQFVGRVRRKGQLSEPIFKTLVTNLPFEARLIEQQQSKMRIMHSHISTDSARLIGENILDLYSEQSNILAKQFLVSYPSLAFKMGINLNVKYAELYFIDMLLKRCVILSQAQAQKMFDYLINGLEVSSQTTTSMVHNSCSIVELKPFVHNLSEIEKENFRLEYVQDKLFAINNLDYKWSCLAKLEHNVEVKNLNKEELEKTFALTPDVEALSYEKIGKFLRHQLNSYYVNSYEKKCYSSSLVQLKNFKKGTYVSFDSSFGKVFGYIHSIKSPPNEYLLSYPTHYLIEIKILNNKHLPKNSLISDTIFIDFHTLMLCPNFKLRENQTVEFEKFESIGEKVSQEFWAVLGNPIFVSYLQKIYSIGHIDYLLINGEKVLSLIISKEIASQTILNFRKPIFDLRKSIDYLLYEKKPIFSSPSSDYEGNITVVPSTGGANLEVLGGYNDKKVFDFAMNKSLGTYTYKNGKKHYFVTYKLLLKNIAMLKKRGVNFFI